MKRIVVIQDYGEVMGAENSDNEQCQDGNSTEQHHKDIESSNIEQCQEEGNSIEQCHENIESSTSDNEQRQEEDNSIEQHHKNIKSPPPLPPPHLFSFTPSPELNTNDTELQHFNESDILIPLMMTHFT
ncbi:2716_t:CDS:1 [Paraglomus brasilianum]|uniref:2716_t:CDS:1 n=1 Tax=Paraglomus brasilianum TaxID=144538 RepID=A0A9N9FHR7_9GLOM|nr:2716_t:CDS:1 [Paraglomus brasilianum]